jgi:hypothetical protein
MSIPAGTPESPAGRSEAIPLTASAAAAAA